MKYKLSCVVEQSFVDYLNNELESIDVNLKSVHGWFERIDEKAERYGLTGSDYDDIDDHNLRLSALEKRQSQLKVLVNSLTPMNDEKED